METNKCVEDAVQMREKRPAYVKKLYSGDGDEINSTVLSSSLILRYIGHIYNKDLEDALYGQISESPSSAAPHTTRMQNGKKRWTGFKQ